MLGEVWCVGSSFHGCGRLAFNYIYEGWIFKKRQPENVLPPLEGHIMIRVPDPDNNFITNSDIKNCITPLLYKLGH